MYKVLIVEDQFIPRQLFEMYIHPSEDFQLEGTITDASLALAFCQMKKPDLILMDVITSGEKSGLDAAEEIKRVYPFIKIMIITSIPEYSWIKRAKEAGVDSFWYKDAQETDLLEAMRCTMRGESVYPGDTPLVAIGKTSNHDFTDRELEILRELISGDTNAVIGERMNLSSGTIKRHVENMLAKTGFRTRTELVAEASRVGIVIRKK